MKKYLILNLVFCFVFYFASMAMASDSFLTSDVTSEVGHGKKDVSIANVKEDHCSGQFLINLLNEVQEEYGSLPNPLPIDVMYEIEQNCGEVIERLGLENLMRSEDHGKK